MQNLDLRRTIQLYKGFGRKGMQGLGLVADQCVCVCVCVCVRARAYLTVFGIRRRVDRVSVPFVSRYEFLR